MCEKCETLRALSNLVRERRISMQLTQIELSADPNVPTSTIGKLEQGRSPDVSFFTVVKLCRSLNIDLGDLFQPCRLKGKNHPSREVDK